MKAPILLVILGSLFSELLALNSRSLRRQLPQNNTEPQTNSKTPKNNSTSSSNENLNCKFTVPASGDTDGEMQIVFIDNENINLYAKINGSLTSSRLKKWRIPKDLVKKNVGASNQKSFKTDCYYNSLDSSANEQDNASGINNCLGSWTGAIFSSKMKLLIVVSNCKPSEKKLNLQDAIKDKNSKPGKISSAKSFKLKLSLIGDQNVFGGSVNRNSSDELVLRQFLQTVNYGTAFYQYTFAVKYSVNVQFEIDSAYMDFTKNYFNESGATAVETQTLFKHKKQIISSATGSKYNPSSKTAYIYLINEQSDLSKDTLKWHLNAKGLASYSTDNKHTDIIYLSTGFKEIPQISDYLLLCHKIGHHFSMQHEKKDPDNLVVNSDSITGNHFGEKNLEYAMMFMKFLEPKCEWRAIIIYIQRLEQNEIINLPESDPCFKVINDFVYVAP